MILSNFKTFTKKVCNGNEQTAYRYLDEIERGAMAIGEYGRESFDYIPKTGRYFNAYTDEYYVFDLVKPAKWELVDENGEKVGEIDYIVDKTEIPDGVELGDEIEAPKYRAGIHLAK